MPTYSHKQSSTITRFTSCSVPIGGSVRESSIKQSLEEGITVVADRYAFSGISFSAAKGLPFEFCLNPDAGLPLPDLTLFLTLPVEVASARSAYGSERYETVELQTRVRTEFASVAEEVINRHGKDRWVSVDATGSMDKVEEAIWQNVETALAQTKGAIGCLWT